MHGMQLCITSKVEWLKTIARGFIIAWKYKYKDFFLFSKPPLNPVVFVFKSLLQIENMNMHNIALSHCIEPLMNAILNRSITLIGNSSRTAEMPIVCIDYSKWIMLKHEFWIRDNLKTMS